MKRPDAGDNNNAVRELFLAGVVFGIDGEWRDIAAGFRALGDPGEALFVHFVDADDGMQGYERAGHIAEFGLQGFLGGIHHDGGLFPEDQLFYFNEPEQ